MVKSSPRPLCQSVPRAELGREQSTMQTPSALYRVMTMLPPPFSTAEAQALALDRWGIAARAEALRGERDRNFHLYAADGREFVLKIANPAEDAGFRALQIAALNHVARVDPKLPVPRVIPLPDGST